MEDEYFGRGYDEEEEEGEEEEEEEDYEEEGDKEHQLHHGNVNFATIPSVRREIRLTPTDYYYVEEGKEESQEEFEGGDKEHQLPFLRHDDDQDCDGGQEDV